MNWKDLGQTIADSAPLLGTLLGGPPGAAVGSLVAGAFGTKASPDELAEAIKRDPEAALKLRQIELDNKAELQRLTLAAETQRLAEDTKKIQSVNATMQSEAQSKWWFSAAWRPFWGVTSALAFMIIVVGIVYLTSVAIEAGDYNMLTIIPQIIMAMAALFAIPGAILGVSAWHRGQMQRVQAGEVKGNGLIGALASRIKNGSKRA